MCVANVQTLFDFAVTGVRIESAEPQLWHVGGDVRDPAPTVDVSLSPRAVGLPARSQ